MKNNNSIEKRGWMPYLGGPTITGKVIDYSTGKPMGSVNIYLKNSPSIGTASLPDGTFILNVSDLTTIVFSHLGYETIDYSSDDIPSNVYMIPKVEELDEVLLIYKKNNYLKFIAYLGLFALALFIAKNSSENNPKENKINAN